MKTTSYNLNEASKYSKISLQGEGTIYLSFRDLEYLINKQFPNKSPQNLKAIDYGCGAGRSTRYLKSLGIQEVDSFDISKSMIQEATEYDPKGNYKLIDSAKIPVPDSIYDIAFMSFVTVAIDDKDQIAQIFNELGRVLKRGGVIFSLTLSEAFWDPRYQWVSYKQDYPENYSPQSGQKSRLIINSIGLELVDSYWKESDIINCAKQANLSTVNMHYPLGKEEDGIVWKDETTVAPYTIFTFKNLQ